MPDLLADPGKETWKQMAVNDPTGVESFTPKRIDPNAQLKLAARDKAADPFAGLEEVKNDPFSGLEEVQQFDAFSGLTPADSLDLKDTKSLIDDDTFRPADYLAANPNLRTDAEKSKKLIDVYRARQIRGLQAGKVLKAAATEAPGIVAKTVKGVRDLGARIIETGIQPAATSVLSTLTGASVEEKAATMAEQGKQQLKAVGEVTAGTESAVTGLAQLGQQGMRKLFGKSPEKMTDSELLDQLYLDSEFSKTTKEVSEGRGDAVKAAGLDADTLAKNGVTLDRDAIEHLSLVDPLTLVAVGGAFKVVGLGGKVIATAATRAGAQTVINGLGKVAQTVGAKGIEAAGKTAVTVGKTVKGAVENFPAKSVGFILGATKTGTLQGGAIGAAAGEAAKRIVIESSGELAKKGAQIAELGSQVVPGFIGPRSAGLSRLISLPSTTAGKIATRTAGGAVQGAITAAPLVAAADDSQTAGALLGGGIALGAIHGVATGGKAAIAETVAKNYLDPHNIPFEKTNSPGYGVDAALDKSHELAFNTLPEQEQNAINTFREAARAGGGEIYVQDSAEYLNRIRENLQQENGGQPLSPAQEAQAKLYADTHAFFDGSIPDAKGETRRVVFLNSDSTGLHHDAGHLFQSLLSPENQAALRESAFSSYSPEQLQAFKDEYARRIGEPDYFERLGDQADAKAADELIAENFGQLFQNKTFADLSAPRPFLKKLGDVAVQAGEALGFDLTANRKTADLGVTPSLRLQDLLRNAAQDVLTREPSKLPAPEKKSLGLRPEDVVRREQNTPVTKEIPPEAVVPKVEVSPKEPVSPTGEKPPVVPSPTAKNIRVERTSQEDFASRRAEETGIVEAQKATESTPEVRKVVDDIAESMQRGNPVLEVEHRGIVSEKGPAAPEGRTSRRGTQEAGYQELERLQIENRAEAPADIVDLHQKTFVPVRFTTQGGKPTLIAMSLDKVIANVRRVVKDSVANKAESLLPYPVENGKLTDAGWKQAISDVQAYSENQSNGLRGDGQKLVRPTEDIGVSLPAENPDYTPKMLSEGAMNFANLVQGLAPPETGRVQKGLTPGNVKGQLLAEVNKKQPMRPAVIKPENVTKQGFKGFEPREVAETNPLRNELAARGVMVRELTEVTERLAVADIASVKPRPDINFKAPVTDIIRGGFLPGEKSVAELGPEVAKMSAGDWKKFTGASLTKTAYELGLGLTNKADLELLRQFQAEAEAKSKTALQQFRETDSEVARDEASLNGTKSQFFREAAEAATDTGSAKVMLRRVIPGAKPPFAGESAKFLPYDEEVARIKDLLDRGILARDPGLKITDHPRGITWVSPEGDFFSGSSMGNGHESWAMDYIVGGNVDTATSALGIFPGVRNLIGTAFAKKKGWTPVWVERGDGPTAGIFVGGKMNAKQKSVLEDLAFRSELPVLDRSTDKILIDNTAEFQRKGDEPKFLPRTEAGKKAAESGIDFEMTGDIGNRSIFIKKNGIQVGDIMSSSTSDLTKVNVASVNVKPSVRGKGIGEAAYRELLTQLKEDGVKEVGGMTVSGAPLAIREKIFGKGSTEVNDVGGSDRGAIPVDQAISELNDGGLGFEAKNKITPESKFLPKQKRDKQGRPLTKDGLVDYERLYKELTKQRAEQQKEDDASRASGAYDVTEGSTTPTGKATGWILPTGEFHPLKTSFHERELAENREAWNKKFGTKFSKTEDVTQRLDAVNAGFVRIRREDSGRYSVEVSTKHWTPKIRRAVLNQIQDKADSIESLSVSLLNDRGGVVDSIQEQVFELEGADRVDVLTRAVDSLRGGSAKFLPKEDRFYDVIDFIEGEIGRIRTKSSDAGASGAGSYDNPVYPDLVKRTSLRKIFSNSGGVAVDVAAQAAYDAHQIKEPTADALLEAIDRASQARKQFRGQSSEERKYIEQLKEDDIRSRIPF